ncbi:MAG: hypothetical protein QF827_14240 [Alphaproteobacteria bacterium]|jgi:hypothetical protein|nr:hypothetical protein [Alphaproteobacteria bacterium]
MRLLTLVPVAAALLALIAVASGQAAAQTDKVYGTTVTEGLFEVQTRGTLDFDDDPDKSGKQKHKFTMGYGLTDFWWTEIIMELERDGEEDADLIYEATEIENVFELAEEDGLMPGLGLYTEIVIAEKEGKANALKWRALGQKHWGPTRHRLNVNFDWELGTNADEDIKLGYAWQTKWKLWKLFSPGFEAYGDFGEISDFKSGADQKHQIGPIVYIEHPIRETGKIELLLGYYVGLSRAAADQTFRWMLEYKAKF